MLVSCRSLVVEERRDCPSFLFFDIANHGRLDSYHRVRIADFTYPESNFLVADTTVIGRIQDKSFYMKVPKSDAVQGFAQDNLGFDILCQVPVVYAFNGAYGAHRHKDGGPDFSVVRGDDSRAGGGGRVCCYALEFEHQFFFILQKYGKYLYFCMIENTQITITLLILCK